jgi:hypothetical protein
MYDSTTAADIPADAVMVAGYIDGLYAWHPADWARFPGARHVRIAVNPATSGADVYDVETGDLTPAQCPAVWRRERARGREPVAYVNRANRAQVMAAFDAAGLYRPHVWQATLDNSQPWDPGVVAIQYAGQAITGKHYDLSVVEEFWPGVDPAPSSSGGSTMFDANDIATVQKYTLAGAAAAYGVQLTDTELDQLRLTLDPNGDNIMAVIGKIAARKAPASLDGAHHHGA